MQRRSTVRLPLAMATVLAAVLATAMLGRPEAALFAAPWAALLALGIPSADRRLVRARVELAADRVMVGDDVGLDVVVEADAPGWIEVRPTPERTFWPAGSKTADRQARAAGRSADIVGPGRPTRIGCPLSAGVWGAHDVGRVEVSLHEAYGLFEWSGVVDETRRLRVHPAPIDLRRLITPWLVRRQTGVHPSVAVERGIEFADTREFGAGDSLRDINWRATARSQRLLVSQRHPERSTDVILLIDSFVESGHDVRAIVGVAIEAAIALAESHLLLTDRVGVVELGGIVRWVNPGTGRHQLHLLTDALLGTRLYANATERDLAVIPSQGLPPRSFVVALSPLLDRRFVDALHLLRAGGHDVAVVECVYEPGSERRSPSAASRAATKLFEAEQAVVRDHLAERGIVIGRWHGGEHLDAVLAEIIARRRRSGRSGR